MVTVWIDEFVPCLKNSQTGEIVDTEVVQVTRRSFLSKFNKKTRWYVNWADLLKENEVYALVLKGTMDIQGMVALKKNDDAKAIETSWICAAPENNPKYADSKKYIGVGGHLFAIAIDKSMEYGYDGVITGAAINKELLEHYCSVFGALHIGMTHSFQFAIFEVEAAKIRKEYSYEWTDAKL